VTALGCWSCDPPAHRVGPLLRRARRLARAVDLDALAEEVGHVERAWIDGRIDDTARLGLLALWRRRHHELLDLQIVTRPKRDDPRSLRNGGCRRSDLAGHPTT